MSFTHKTRPTLRSPSALALPFDDSPPSPRRPFDMKTFPWHRCPTMWNPQGPRGSERVTELILANDPEALTRFGARWWDLATHTWRDDHQAWMENIP
jgi:hypothetical protein